MDKPKTSVSLCLQQADGLISRPFMRVDADDDCVIGLLEALGRLGKYVPIRSVINDHLVTGLTYDATGVSLQGQEIKWQGGR